ncbi:MAG: hypothetical protein FWD23_04840 [Oscillospiraceae bacterium]|nr:hypothetical protein [Oscillospiraceae bacterium]
MRSRQKRESLENGYITIETLGTFLPFVFLVVSILSLVNIVTVQTRVHYALTQAANTISVYGRAKNFGPETNAGEPREIIGYIIDCAPGEPDDLSEAAVRELIGRYLSNGDAGGNEYLKSANVIGGLEGLEFCDTGFLANKDGEISLSVRYEIEYKFGALPLPFEPKLKVTQQAKTKAWQGGAGEGYNG